MKALRTRQLLQWSMLMVFASGVLIVSAQNPMAHVDIKTVKSYEGKQPLSKPDRVVVYDFDVAPEAVKTDPMPGVRQRIKNSGSSEDKKTRAADEVRDEITADTVKGLQKRLKQSGILVEKGTPEMQMSGNTLVVRGTVTKLDQGRRIGRETVGLGRGSSDVKTDAKISLESSGQSVLLSELTTEAKSSKKPGAAVTMGAGAAPEVAAATTGATAHRGTAQGDSARTGAALAKRIADMMKTQGWITHVSEPDSETQAQK